MKLGALILAAAVVFASATPKFIYGRDEYCRGPLPSELVIVVPTKYVAAFAGSTTTKDMTFLKNFITGVGSDLLSSNPGASNAPNMKISLVVYTDAAATEHGPYSTVSSLVSGVNTALPNAFTETVTTQSLHAGVVKGIAQFTSATSTQVDPTQRAMVIIADGKNNIDTVTEADAIAARSVAEVYVFSLQRGTAHASQSTPLINADLIASAPVVHRSFSVRSYYDIYTSSVPALSTSLIQLLTGSEHVGLTCTMHGDPHIVTYDGTKYSFQGYGEFYLVRPSNKLSDSPTVQVRNVPCNGNDAAVPNTVADPPQSGTMCARAIAVGIPNGGKMDTVSFEFERVNNVLEVVVNGMQKTPGASSFMVGDASVMVRAMQNGGYSVFVFRTSDWFDLYAEFTATGGIIAVTLHSKHMNMVTGLCGNFDQCPANDLIFRYNGQIVNAMTVPEFDKAASRFGASWKVHQSDNMFDHALNHFYVRPWYFIPAVGTNTSTVSPACDGLHGYLIETCNYDVGAQGSAGFSYASQRLNQLACHQVCRFGQMSAPLFHSHHCKCSMPTGVDLHAKYENNLPPSFQIMSGNLATGFMRPALGGTYKMQRSTQGQVVTVDVKCTGAVPNLQAGADVIVTPVYYYGLPMIHLNASADVFILSDFMISWKFLSWPKKNDGWLPPMLHNGATLNPSFDPFQISDADLWNSPRTEVFGDYELEVAMSDSCQIWKDTIKVTTQCSGCNPTMMKWVGSPYLSWTGSSFEGTYMIDAPEGAGNYVQFTLEQSVSSPTMDEVSADGEQGTVSGLGQGTLSLEVVGSGSNPMASRTATSSMATVNYKITHLIRQASFNNQTGPSSTITLPDVPGSVPAPGSWVKTSGVYPHPHLEFISAGGGYSYASYQYTNTSYTITTQDYMTEDDLCDVTLQWVNAKTAKVTVSVIQPQGAAPANSMYVRGEACIKQLTLTAAVGDPCVKGENARGNVSIAIQPRCPRPPVPRLECDDKWDRQADSSFGANAFSPVTITARESYTVQSPIRRYVWSFSTPDTQPGWEKCTGSPVITTQPSIDFVPPYNGTWTVVAGVDDQCSISGYKQQVYKVYAKPDACPKPTASGKASAKITPNGQLPDFNKFGDLFTISGGGTFRYFWTYTMPENYPRGIPIPAVTGLTSATPSISNGIGLGVTYSFQIVACDGCTVFGEDTKTLTPADDVFGYIEMPTMQQAVTLVDLDGNTINNPGQPNQFRVELDSSQTTVKGNSGQSNQVQKRYWYWKECPKGYPCPTLQGSQTPSPSVYEPYPNQVEDPNNGKLTFQPPVEGRYTVVLLATDYWHVNQTEYSIYAGCATPDINLITTGSIQANTDFELEGGLATNYFWYATMPDPDTTNSKPIPAPVSIKSGQGTKKITASATLAGTFTFTLFYDSDGDGQDLNTNSIRCKPRSVTKEVVVEPCSSPTWSLKQAPSQGISVQFDGFAFPNVSIHDIWSTRPSDITSYAFAYKFVSAPTSPYRSIYAPNDTLPGTSTKLIWSHVSNPPITQPNSPQQMRDHMAMVRTITSEGMTYVFSDPNSFPNKDLRDRTCFFPDAPGLYKLMVGVVDLSNECRAEYQIYTVNAQCGPSPNVVVSTASSATLGTNDDFVEVELDASGSTPGRSGINLGEGLTFEWEITSGLNVLPTDRSVQGGVLFRNIPDSGRYDMVSGMYDVTYWKAKMENDAVSISDKFSPKAKLISAVPGTYTVSVTVRDGCSVITRSKSITINPTPSTASVTAEFTSGPAIGTLVVPLTDTSDKSGASTLSDQTMTTSTGNAFVLSCLKLLRQWRIVEYTLPGARQPNPGPTPTPPPNPSGTPTPSEGPVPPNARTDSSSGASKGTVAGVAVGCIAAGAIIGGAGGFMAFKKRRAPTNNIARKGSDGERQERVQRMRAQEAGTAEPAKEVSTSNPIGGRLSTPNIIVKDDE